LEFQEDLSITAMFSGENERIEFVKKVIPKGNVENWLLEVESIMRKSVKQVIKDGLASYTVTERDSWVQSWPGQVALTASQIVWTKQVSEAISEKKEGLKNLYAQQLSQLEDLTKLVRGELTPLARATLGSLIVIDVHARDVVSNLIKSGVTDERDFEWMSQLRYYWDGEDVVVRIVNASFRYGYEYLGNTTRLVITPLTDRCYITLTGALHMQLGGAPQGPAGTGKTETTKDLAKALAKQCVVFNCSEGLNHLAMEKFFKGLASSGAWSCFDEFNRIELEVLSVIAQQIMSIQKAIQINAKRFLFEGMEISLDPTCAVFITMNPGYAGRSELPDNLKVCLN
jgi:dynein heavy chain